MNVVYFFTPGLTRGPDTIYFSKTSVHLDVLNSTSDSAAKRVIMTGHTALLPVAVFAPTLTTVSCDALASLAPQVLQ